LSEVRRHLQTHPNGVDGHERHASTITSGMPVRSAHVGVEDSPLADSGHLLAPLHDRLPTHVAIHLPTIRVAPVGRPHHRDVRRSPAPLRRTPRTLKTSYFRGDGPQPAGQTGIILDSPATVLA